MMLYKIHSHAQIQDLQARSDELGHSNKSMLVGLLSLESVCIACESYALLCPLIMESRSWECPELDSLSDVAGLSLEIQKLEHDVLPQLTVQEAKLERGALEALLLMKNSAIKLLHMSKCFKEALGVLLAEEDLVSAKVKKLSIVLKDTAVHVLEGKCNIVWLQERVPWLVQLVTDVLETPVRFCDPDEYSDEYSDIKSSSVCAVPAGSSNCSAAVCQKEMMLYKIHSHAQIQALQDRSDELGHSNEHMLVKLVSLESVRIARESYALLCPLIMESRSWECLELDSFSVVAGLSLEIQKLEHDLLPQLMVQEAKLERGALEALLLMKNSAITLLHLSKCFKEALGVLLDEEDLVSAQVEVLSEVLEDIAVHVLEGNCNGVWLQPRVPLLVQLVTNVLEIPVRF